jgi:hypothetical protein
MITFLPSTCTGLAFVYLIAATEMIVVEEALIQTVANTDYILCALKRCNDLSGNPHTHTKR